MKLYDSFKMPIRVAYLGFVFVAIGFLIQNKNVNLFYTFKSSIILFVGELFLKIGEFVIMNLPLIFMLNIVCKKANSGSPVVMAIVGYFTFLVTTMLLANQSLGSQAYINGYGINSIFNLNSGTRLPLETGLLGSLMIAFITRFSFILSRHRGNYSITNIFSKDIAGIVYVVLMSFACGMIVAYVYPFIYKYVEKGITFISNDLSDPFRIASYSVVDRIMSICGLGNIIRYPFWFTSTGGSLQNFATGQSVLGDVNIWSYVKDNISTYIGAGRFITPYYVINMFMIPGYYLGTLFSITDKKDRHSLTITFLAAIILSIVAGNPLPVELLMLFTSPSILIFYLGLVGITSYVFVSKGVFLGFENTISNTIVAMPGSFPDFIVNVRNSNLSSTLLFIVVTGIIVLFAMMLFVMLYYREFAFDFASTGRGEDTINNIIEAVGGQDNIKTAKSGLFKLNIYLHSPENIDIDLVRQIGARRVSETKDGISFELGTSSYAIAKRINSKLSSHQ